MANDFAGAYRSEASIVAIAIVLAARAKRSARSLGKHCRNCDILESARERRLRPAMIRALAARKRQCQKPMLNAVFRYSRAASAAIEMRQ